MYQKRYMKTKRLQKSFLKRGERRKKEIDINYININSMKYVTEPKPKAPMLLDKYIGFTLDEMDLVGDAITKTLEKELVKAQKRYEKYLDIQESGEATTRQQTLFFEAEEKYNALDRMVVQLKELRNLSKGVKLR